ncbi:unnamed protein product [Brassica oleracea]|uniref:Uncharacterized protein n=1 Tax=Brassica oleracea TaxID=3712 RepID=A0A3P6E597_BRAOL|nr:unnamed protein product [Brassica oleracea]
MVGALFVVGSSVMDSPNGPCLCLDAHARSSRNKKKILGSSAGSSFTGSVIVFRLSSKRVPRIATRRSKRRLLIVNEDVAGNYNDTFGDVKTVRKIINKNTLEIIFGLWSYVSPLFYNSYVVSNRPTDGKRFLRTLGKVDQVYYESTMYSLNESQELAERVMITRLHLPCKWIKKCDHGKIYQDITDENLALMRERLMETVIWPIPMIQPEEEMSHHSI